MMQIHESELPAVAVRSLANFLGGRVMTTKMLPHLAFPALFGSILASMSCSSSPAGCPVCGTDKNATVGLIDVMLVPGHSASGAPAGPFNSFDISWMDTAN